MLEKTMSLSLTLAYKSSIATFKTSKPWNDQTKADNSQRKMSTESKDLVTTTTGSHSNPLESGSLTEERTIGEFCLSLHGSCMYIHA